MKLIIRSCLAAMLLVSQFAYGLTLDEARQQGLVGETFTGYIALVRETSEAKKLVEEINAARLESYQQLAQRNNIPVNEVAKMAGQKLVARAKPGEYVRGLNGRWLQKTP